jgi:hypothetical protein
MGDIALASALRRRTITLEGPDHLVRSFPRWFGLGSLVGLERPGASGPRRLVPPLP